MSLDSAIYDSADSLAWQPIHPRLGTFQSGHYVCEVGQVAAIGQRPIIAKPSDNNYLRAVSAHVVDAWRQYIELQCNDA